CSFSLPCRLTLSLVNEPSIVPADARLPVHFLVLTIVVDGVVLRIYLANVGRPRRRWRMRNFFRRVQHVRLTLDGAIVDVVNIYQKIMTTSLAPAEKGSVLGTTARTIRREDVNELADIIADHDLLHLNSWTRAGHMAPLQVEARSPAGYGHILMRRLKRSMRVRWRFSLAKYNINVLFHGRSRRPLCLVSCVLLAFLRYQDVLPHVMAFLSQHPQYAYLVDRATDQALIRVWATDLTVTGSEKDRRSSKLRGGAIQLSLDLSQAFDRLEWPLISDSLKEAGVPSDLYHLIISWHREMYYHIKVSASSARVSVGRG
ncbi:unnamed protein product, partial [Symbiodinium sp. CCMP2456]